MTKSAPPSPAKLDFGPLHCSTASTLGDYYQDFSAAAALVESGYHGGLDADGVPLTAIGGIEFHSATTIAQYALANLTLWLRGDSQRGDRVQVLLDWLVAGQQPDGEWAGCWLMEHDDPKYPWLRVPWTSSLTSGNAISALLRGWEQFGVDAYRTSAEAGYQALHSLERTQVLFEESDDTLWYEEYPAAPPLHVLNGHLYTVLGVLDYARVSADEDAQLRWRRAADTALRALADFDLGYWSAYDSREREPASLHYHKNIHIPLLRIFAALTGDSDWSLVADRWETYLKSVRSRAWLTIGLRLRRFQRR